MTDYIQQVTFWNISVKVSLIILSWSLIFTLAKAGWEDIIAFEVFKEIPGIRAAHDNP